MDTKYIHHIHPHSPFLCNHPSHWYTPPQKRLSFPTCTSFFKIKYTLIVQGGFALVLQVCLYHALIKLTSSPHYLLILYHCAPLILNRLLYSALYY
jgi:hypothetical protein